MDSLRLLDVEPELAQVEHHGEKEEERHGWRARGSEEDVLVDAQQGVVWVGDEVRGEEGVVDGIMLGLVSSDALRRFGVEGFAHQHALGGCIDTLGYRVPIVLEELVEINIQNSRIGM